MADPSPERMLAALLAQEAEVGLPAGANTGASAPRPLPSLDERVELFLRAMYGTNDVTAVQRATARERILDTMVESLAGGPNDEGARGRAARVAAPAAMGAVRRPAHILASLREALL